MIFRSLLRKKTLFCILVTFWMWISLGYFLLCRLKRKLMRLRWLLFSVWPLDGRVKQCFDATGTITGNFLFFFLLLRDAEAEMSQLQERKTESKEQGPPKDLQVIPWCCTTIFSLQTMCFCQLKVTAMSFGALHVQCLLYERLISDHSFIVPLLVYNPV